MKPIPMKALLAFAAATLFSGTALAQQGPAGVVVGVAGGFSKYNDSCEGVSGCDTSDRALRFNAGYGFGNGLVVEGVVLDFGKLRGNSGGIAAEIGARAVGGGIALYLPAGGNAELFVRLGLAQVKVNARGSGFGITVSDSESHTAAYAGVGFGWKLSPGMALELAYESTQAKYAGDKGNVSAGTIGLSFRF